MEKLFIAGHRGLVGSAMLRQCQNYEPITVNKSKVDLRNQQQVEDFFRSTRPDIVVICAAKVGGIYANSKFPAEFIYDNIMIQSNIINSSFKFGVNRLMFLGSTCIYPKFAPQPLKEECLLTGSLEPTNEAYAIAKIAGLKMCESYTKQYGVLYHSVMPTNLYGINDNYHPDYSHVIPGLIRKIHEAKLRKDKVYEIWGSGTPKREFMYADDLANICYKLLELKNPPPLVNIGTDTELTILELVREICKLVEFEGEIKTGDPALDGTPRKKTDCSLLKSLVSYTETPFQEGLSNAFTDYISKTAQ
jgi:GDP-L-fucose synthase